MPAAEWALEAETSATAGESFFVKKKGRKKRVREERKAMYGGIHL